MRTKLSWALIALLPVLFLCLYAGDTHVSASSVALNTLLPLMFIGAIGKASDFQIYSAEFQTGIVESIAQWLTVFNESSRGAIRLVPRALKGHYSRAAFFKDLSGLVTRRDITVTTAVTPLAMTQDEVISVKLNRKIGPVAQTLDAMKKAGLTEGDASRVFGQLAGMHKMRDMLNTGLLAGEAAIQNVAANNLDITALATKTASTAQMQNTLAKMGDASQNVVCWIMHSKPNNDVLQGLITDKVSGLSDIVTIQGAVPALLGRPAIVTDSPALTDGNGSAADTYNTLGLVRDAIVVEESEDESYFTDIIASSENLYRIFQAEYAYNVTIKGFKWDIGNGGVNPADAALVTGSNWDKVASDDKNIAGVRLLSQ